MSIELLNKENLGLVVIDVQPSLMAAMSQRQLVVENQLILLKLAEVCDLPVVVTEQNSERLGATLPEIQKTIKDFDPIPKMHFNSCLVDAFNERLKSLGLKKIILTGVETHVCVFQTCLSLLEQGYTVHLPIDAVDSRTEDNWQSGAGLMKQAGAVITSTEAVVFQVLEKAGTDEFRAMLPFIK